MILCTGCGKPNPIPDTFYIEYFLSNKYSACDCARVADAWEQALHTIKTNFMLTNALDLIGAHSSQASLNELSKDNVAEYLCGVLFAYHYFEFAKKSLNTGDHKKVNR